MAGIGCSPPPPSGMPVAGMGVNPILTQALIANTIVRTTSLLSIGIPDEAHLDYNHAAMSKLYLMMPVQTER
jgi:hypothetical protein